MDIPALSMALSQMKTASSVNVAVMKMAMETAQENSEMVTQLLADMGSAIDVSV